MRRSSLIATLATVAISATCSPAAARVQAQTVAYAIQEVAVPWVITTSQAQAIDDSGDVLGGASNGTDPVGYMFVWNGGTVRELHPAVPQGADHMSVSTADIGPDGTVVGHYEGTCGGQSCDFGAYMLDRSGKTTLIPGPMGYATAINGHDQVAGDGGVGGFDHAMLWSQGTTTDLGTLGGRLSNAADVNGLGQVVGQSAGPNDSGGYAYLWQNGHMQSLGTLGGCSSHAYGINDLGQVVGIADTSGNCAAQSHAFLWKNGQMADLGTLPGCYPTPHAINDSDQVVGECDYPLGSGSTAFLWQNGAMTDLNDLIPGNSGWDLITATDINSHGQIVGTGYVNGQYRAFLLTPSSGSPLLPSPQRAGVVGTDNELFSWQPGGGFTPLGGALLAAPAVAVLPPGQSGQPPVTLYVGLGTDHNLYVRSDSQGWQPLTTTSTYCIDSPALLALGTASNATMTVGCQGSDHALYVATGSFTGGLPRVGAWTSYGGYLMAGPAVAYVDGVTSFFGIGTDSFVYRHTGGGWDRLKWQCIGHPAAGSSAGFSYFACQGLDHALWYSIDDGSGWLVAYSAGGALIDGPGLAATRDGATFYVEGTDGELYQTSLPIGRTTTTGFIPDGGAIQHGAGAAGF
ncbi:MAG: DUF3466 family protein [Chloroflexi bacterium]|nr:DUF3466 family protein [Chloroflexota bacterium]